MAVRASSASRCSVKFPPRPPRVETKALPPRSKSRESVARGGSRVRASSASAAVRSSRDNGGGSGDAGDSGFAGHAVLATFGRNRTLVFPPTGWQDRKSDSSPPDAELCREYVFGYNADCWNSVHFISEDEIAYPVAALVVVANVQTNQQQFFEGHNADVTCVSWNGSRRLCASGQTDPKGVGGPFVCVWSPEFCDRTISRLYHHERAVRAVAISHDGQTVVSFGGDDACTMCIWKKFAAWDGMTGPPAQNMLREPPVQSVAPMFHLSSGREWTRSIFMWPASPRDDEITFHTIVERSQGAGTGGAFKFWNVRFDVTGRNLPPEITHKRGTFGKQSATGKPLDFALSCEPGTVWMAGDNGRLYTVRGSTVTSEIKVAFASVNKPGAHARSTPTVALGCIAGLPGRRWIAGANDGSIYTGCLDDLHRLRVLDRLFLAELGGDFAELGSAENPRLRTIAINPQYTFAIFGTANHALLLVQLGPPLKGVRVLQVSHSQEAWAMDFHPSLAVLVTASGVQGRPGAVRFWNVAERRPRVGVVLRLESAARSLAFSPDGKLLAFGCYNGIVDVVGFPSLQSTFRQRVSKQGDRITDLAFSWCNHLGGNENQGMLLAAACSDTCIYLLRVLTPSTGGPAEIRVHKTLGGNSASLVSVMFTASGDYIMSNSADTQILYWRTKDGARLTAASAFRDAKWQSPWTCLFGWQAIGVWSDPEYDGTDVNSVCQSMPPADGYIASGDDSGQVNLFRFPSCAEQAAFRRRGGHSSHVTKVKFSCTNVLATLGGDDHSIGIWSLRGAGAEEDKSTILQHPWARLNEEDFDPNDRFQFLGRSHELQSDAAKAPGRPETQAAREVPPIPGFPRRVDPASGHGAGEFFARPLRPASPAAGYLDADHRRRAETPTGGRPSTPQPRRFDDSSSVDVAVRPSSGREEANRQQHERRAGTPSSGRRCSHYYHNHSAGVGHALRWD